MRRNWGILGTDTEFLQFRIRCLSPEFPVLLFRQYCVMMDDVSSDQLTDHRSRHHIGWEVIQPADARQADSRRESVRTENNERLVVIFPRHDGRQGEGAHRVA